MLYLAADHRGFQMKEQLKSFLKESGFEFEDLGNAVEDQNDDYTDFAAHVAQKISAKPNEHRGIVICGSGVGVDITANRFKGVRCGLAIDREQVASARLHDDINCLALAADYIEQVDAEELVTAFLKTNFSGEERYARRLAKLDTL